MERQLQMTPGGRDGKAMILDDVIEIMISLTPIIFKCSKSSNIMVFNKNKIKMEEIENRKYYLLIPRI